MPYNSGMKKNLLAIAAVLAMVGAVLCLGYAALQAVILYQVETTGMFHGEVYSARSTIYIGVCALWVGVALYFVSLGCARIAARHQRGDQHPKSTIRVRPDDE